MIKVIFSNGLRKTAVIVAKGVIIKDFMDKWGLERNLSTHGVFVNGVPLLKPELDVALGDFAVDGVVHLTSAIKLCDVNNRIFYKCGMW